MTVGRVSQKALSWFESRGIGAETVVRIGIFSGARRAGGDDRTAMVCPDPNGNVIVFPFYERGEIVAEKYRAAGKRFWQKPGGTKTFYNADILDDRALADGSAALVITEGELDCLSAIEAGCPFVVSVPDGAPPARDGEGRLIDVPETADGIDPARDDKFKFIVRNWSRLEAIRRIVIAVDNDEPGTRLAAELVRRLGRVRCSFVTMPEGCKDFNDVLRQHGGAEIARMIAVAKPYPVSRLYRVSEIPQEPDLNPAVTGWPELNEHLRVYHPALMVVTGFANAGKSSWALQLVAQLATRHGWPAAIASFEMRVKPFVTDLLGAAYLGKARCEWSFDEHARARDWLEQNFVFIAPDPDKDEDATVSWLLEKAAAAVIRYGVRVVLLDPWNEIDHGKEKDETTTDYIGRALRMVKRFARRMDVLVIIVAHPSKAAIAKGRTQKDLSLYDISDCYSSDTEILTRRGWLPFPQVTLSDEVACFDMDAEVLRYEQPTAVHRYAHDGLMAHFQGRSLDLLVTPNHRMVVKPAWADPVGSGVNTGIGRPTRWSKKAWSFAAAGELSRAPFLVPVAPGLNEGSEPHLIALDHGYLTADFCDLLGWYLAEGHRSLSSIVISQGKEPYKSEIRDLLSAMGLDVHEAVSSSVGVHALATVDTVAFSVRKRATPELVNWLREHCGGRSDTKKLPEAVFDLSPALKRRILMAFIKGDGSFDRRFGRRELIAKATTTSPFLRDGLQRLAVEAGVSCTVGPEVQVKPHHLPSWQLNFVFGRRVVGLDLRSGHLTWEPYKGDVWCLTVPTGAFMVRRNGRPAVSGNSAHFANKSDLGVVIIRDGDHSVVLIRKVRYQPETGKPGEVEMKFDKAAKLFVACEAPDSAPSEQSDVGL